METLNTRDHLLQVGLRRMQATGYASTGVAEILADAGVPKGSFYHHFASKEAFANEVIKLYVREERERTAKILGDRKFPPLKRLRRYFEEMSAIHGPLAADG